MTVLPTELQFNIFTLTLSVAKEINLLRIQYQKPETLSLSNLCMMGVMCVRQWWTVFIHSQIRTAFLAGSWPQRVHCEHPAESPLLSPLERSAEDLRDKQSTHKKHAPVMERHTPASQAEKHGLYSIPQIKLDSVEPIEKIIPYIFSMRIWL